MFDSTKGRNYSKWFEVKLIDISLFLKTLSFYRFLGRELMFLAVIFFLRRFPVRERVFFLFFFNLTFFTVVVFSWLLLNFLIDSVVSCVLFPLTFLVSSVPTSASGGNSKIYSFIFSFAFQSLRRICPSVYKSKSKLAERLSLLGALVKLPIFLLDNKYV